MASAVGKLKTTRADLVDKLAQLKALLAKLESMPQLPPGVRPPGVPGGTVPPSPAEIRKSIAKLEAGIAKLDSGLSQARTGLSKLSEASATIADARAQLRDLRDLARVAADGSTVGVDVARYQLALATLVSPTDGTLVSIVPAGTVLAPGATAAVVRRAGPPRVETWLSPEDAARVSVGDAATVSADWFGTAESGVGRVSKIGLRAEHPPTSFATKDVHMTRAIPVEVTVVPDPGLPFLPPGAPVDLVIRPSERKAP